MPSRWVIPLSRIDDEAVSPTQKHAVISTHLDQGSDHTTRTFAVGRMQSSGDVTILEVGLLKPLLEPRLLQEIKPGQVLRFGHQFATVVDTPRCLGAESWEDLAAAPTRRAWVVSYDTPTTFKNRSRTSPWPDHSSVLRGLEDLWDRWSGLPARLQTYGDARQLWVTDIAGHSETEDVGSENKRIIVSGFVGRVRYQCDDERVATAATPLFELARYSGIGALTSKGFGSIRLEETWQPGGTGKGKPTPWRSAP